MKDIIILKKNGMMVVKDESKLTTFDIEEAKWFLVNVTSTEEELRSYALIKPSKLLLFDKAIISYQLCEKFQDCDYDINIQEFPPVQMNTTSITDVISLINSADKLNIINNLMIEDFSDNSGQMGLTYLAVTLIKNNEVIYDNYYELKGIDGVLFDSFKVVKKFKELYNGNITSDFIREKNYIIFKEKDNVMGWNLSDKPPTKGMFGYPNVVSNSIIIMNAYEYSCITKYIGSNIYYSIYYENTKHIDSITTLIKYGRYDEAFEKLDESSDIFINVARTMHKSAKEIGLILSVICNLKFIFLSTKTMYQAIYTNIDVDMNDPLHDEDHICDFDSVLSITFRKTNREVKTIAFNKDSILTPTQIFNIL